ncbi:MAG: 50S ribosomal protein L35 [Elusimicrobiota bacterium]|jgi:large subunit ribosomal protein L35
MPKLKSHSGAKKRFTKTSSGKWRHQRAYRRHLLTPMPKNKSHCIPGKNTVTKTEGKILSRLLPYS